MQPHVKRGHIVSDIVWPVEVQSPRGFLHFLCVGSKSIWFASAFPFMHSTYPDSERHWDLMVEEY